MAANDALPLTAFFCAATPFVVSRACGEDARAFLNGQLSSDVKTLAAGRWQLSSYSTPKGRALATFAVAAQAGEGGDSFWLITRHGVAEATFKRLGMFVLRSKVRWAHATHTLFGVRGPEAAALLADILGVAPPVAGECVAAAAGSKAAGMIAEGEAATGTPAADPDGASRLLALGLGADAWWLLVPSAAVAHLTDALRAALPESTAADWDAVEVAAGRPWVETGTVEAFVLQMLNLDLTGGISFKKGCYPGQEIVARTQYLGKVKRRMLRFAVPLDAGAGLPQPGTPVHAASEAEQALGQVVLAAPLDAGRVQLLAVLQMDLAEGADLRLGAADGLPLAPLELPYPLDAA